MTSSTLTCDRGRFRRRRDIDDYDHGHFRQPDQHGAGWR